MHEHDLVQIGIITTANAYIESRNPNYLDTLQRSFWVTFKKIKPKYYVSVSCLKDNKENIFFDFLSNAIDRGCKGLTLLHVDSNELRTKQGAALNMHPNLPTSILSGLIEYSDNILCAAFDETEEFYQMKRIRSKYFTDLHMDEFNKKTVNLPSIDNLRQKIISNLLSYGVLGKVRTWDDVTKAADSPEKMDDFMKVFAEIVQEMPDSDETSILMNLFHDNCYREYSIRFDHIDSCPRAKTKGIGFSDQVQRLAASLEDIARFAEKHGELNWADYFGGVKNYLINSLGSGQPPEFKRFAQGLCDLGASKEAGELFAACISLTNKFAGMLSWNDVSCVSQPGYSDVSENLLLEIGNSYGPIVTSALSKQIY